MTTVPIPARNARGGDSPVQATRGVIRHSREWSRMAEGKALLAGRVRVWKNCGLVETCR